MVSCMCGFTLKWKEVKYRAQLLELEPVRSVTKRGTLNTEHKNDVDEGYYTEGMPPPQKKETVKAAEASTQSEGAIAPPIRILGQYYHFAHQNDAKTTKMMPKPPKWTVCVFKILRTQSQDPTVGSAHPLHVPWGRVCEGVHSMPRSCPKIWPSFTPKNKFGLTPLQSSYKGAANQLTQFYLENGCL